MMGEHGVPVMGENEASEMDECGEPAMMITEKIIMEDLTIVDCQRCSSEEVDDICDGVKCPCARLVWEPFAVLMFQAQISRSPINQQRQCIALLIVANQECTSAGVILERVQEQSVRGLGVLVRILGREGRI